MKTFVSISRSYRILDFLTVALYCSYLRWRHDALLGQGQTLGISETPELGNFQFFDARRLGSVGTGTSFCIVGCRWPAFDFRTAPLKSLTCKRTLLATDHFQVIIWSITRTFLIGIHFSGGFGQPSGHYPGNAPPTWDSSFNSSSTQHPVVGYAPPQAPPRAGNPQPTAPMPGWYDSDL